MKFASLYLSMTLLLVSTSAFAIPGTGKVDCSLPNNKIKAAYSWFRSDSDSLSAVSVFVGDTNRDYLVYNGENAAAGKPISVETLMGVVTVSLKADGKSCRIELE